MTFRLDPDPSAEIGRRIAAIRKRRGLSQVKLGLLSGYSERSISDIECGRRRVDRLSSLRVIAAALGVPIADLAEEYQSVVRDQVQHLAIVGQLRQVLAMHLFRTLPAVAAGLHPDSKHLYGPRSLETVGITDTFDPHAADALWEMAERSDYTTLARWLVPAIQASDRDIFHTPTDESRPERLRVASEVYQVASWFLTSLRQADLAWIAGERAATASDLADDSRGVLASTYRVAQALLTGERFADVCHVADLTAGYADSLLDMWSLTASEPGRFRLPLGAVDAGEHPEWAALYGALSLSGAIAAARLVDANQADAFMRRAHRAAAIVGEGRNDYHLQFGPANVGVHGVAVDVELARPTDALRKAEEIDASVLSPERQAYFLVDVARAHGQRRNLDMAVRVLLDAEALAPDQVHSHWAVRPVVADFVKRRRGKLTRPLAGLAQRVGVV